MVIQMQYDFGEGRVRQNYLNVIGWRQWRGETRLSQCCVTELRAALRMTAQRETRK